VLETAVAEPGWPTFADTTALTSPAASPASSSLRSRLEMMAPMFISKLFHLDRNA